VNGSPIVFQTRTSTPFASITGKWLGRDVFFCPSEADRHWYGLAGADVQAKVGQCLPKPRSHKPGSATIRLSTFRLRLLEAGWGMFRNPCPGPFPKSLDLRARGACFCVPKRTETVEKLPKQLKDGTGEFF
jgi:hypothetical protein